jgi:hypothetical protein
MGPGSVNGPELRPLLPGIMLDTETLERVAQDGQMD